MTSNLGLSTITSAQTNKEVGINTIFGQLDGKLTDTVTVTMEQSTASYTLSTENQSRAAHILCAPDGVDPPSSAKDLVFNTTKGFIVIENTTTQDVVCKISTTTQFTIPAARKVLAFNDGTNLKALAIAATTENVTLGLYHKASPTVSEPLWGFLFTEALSLPTNLAGSQFRADTAPSGGSVAFTLHKNGGVSFGTITFANGANTATAVVTATDFAAGDRIEINAPANVQSIAELFLSILGTRTTVA